MQLIITEKPSVAYAIANALGKTIKKQGYLQGEDYLISWCVGHLVSLAPAQQYDARYAKWHREDLPIIPHPWQYVVPDGAANQYRILSQLMHASWVDTVICATDAGREGELIFRLIYQQCQCTKPLVRLWLSSLEESAIRGGLQHLHDSHEYDNLYQAALCRAQADWLVGINATRLFSLLYGTTLHMGRVMSPTLAMLAEREQTIATFQPETFYTVQLHCGFSASSGRIQEKAEAQRMAEACHLQTATVKHIDRNVQAERPPQLYDLTALQRDANRIHGYTAQQTLDYAQSLYDKRLLTYPRTDSRFLPKDMEGKLPGLVRSAAESLRCMRGLNLSTHTEQVIDNSKVTDHHALLPTSALSLDMLLHLPTGERQLLEMVCARLICAVGDPYNYDEVTVKLACAGYSFTAKGRTIRQMGWQIPYQTFQGSLGGAVSQQEHGNPLPALTEGQQLSPVTASVQEGQTTPPASHTDGTLLAAMASAGAADMPKDAERKGLGTPATRAGILEKLVKVGLVERKGSGKAKHLIPTAKGQALVKVLPEQLRSPAMTAEWEERLAQVEHGQASPEDFMRDLDRFVHELVTAATPIPGAHKLFPSNRPKLGDCPCCGSTVSETSRGFFCENPACRFGIWKDNRFLAAKGKPPTAKMVSALLRDGLVRLTGLCAEKTQKTYDATLVLEHDEEGKVRLRLDFSHLGAEKEQDFRAP